MMIMITLQSIEGDRASQEIIVIIIIRYIKMDR
jgi:hypothetical protein